MNVSGTFIERPIATSLLMAAIALFGAVAYRALPVSDLPNVDLPTLLVTASLPGASPETMAAAVATPLENQFTMISGLSGMTSVNSLGATRITLEFDLSRNLDGAAVDVQSAITQAARMLPQGMPTPPTFTKVNPADQPILYLVLTSGTLPLWTLNEYAETRVAQRISMVSGVAQVQVMGAQRYAVHVQLNPRALAARQVGIDEVESALRNWNVNLPVGSIIGPERAFTLQTTGQLMNAAAYRSVIVSYRAGSPIRLEELGQVIDGIEDDKAASWFYKDGQSKRAVVLAIQRQPGTNTMSVTENVKKLLPTFRNELPPSVEMSVLYDRSETIRESFEDVKFTMVLTLGLVIMVIFLFLRNFSATIIPSLALPFSIIGTFAVMYLLDYSLDNLSMMALILSVGFVVDDAIVMLENIVRHMEMGKPPLQAAYMGAREIGFTIVSMTLSLTAVFIPVLFMGGVLGRLFREFAVTICVAVLISGVVSVTLTPMLCSRFLSSMHKSKHGWFYRVTERFFEWLLHIYDVSLIWVLKFRMVTVIGFLILLGATGWSFVRIPKGFIPDQDTDQILGFTEAAQGTSYQQMVEYQQAAATAISRHPHVDALVSSVGGAIASTLGGANFGQLIIHLKPRHERGQSVEQVISDLRVTMAEITGLRTYLQNPPTVQIGGQVTKSPFQLALQSPDKEELFKAAELFTNELAKEPSLHDVTSNLQIHAPQINIKIDRDKAAALRVNVDQIENALYDAYGPRWVSTIYSSVNEYKVLLELLPEYQADPKALSLLYFKGSGQRLIPLDSVASLQEDTGPQTVNHFGQLPAVTVSFNTRPGVPLGEAAARVNEVAGRTLPPSIGMMFQGSLDAFNGSQTNLSLLLFVAILVVYIVLGILYESYIHPLTILSGLPSAGFGALLTLMFFQRDLNIYGFVGLIMLIGIVMKNAIMQIDFALEAERSSHMSPKEAIYKGCLIRFRPIIMTTMAALLGAVPIAVGYGAGGDARQSLGLVVVGGLVFSQMVTLYLTPVVYTYLAALQSWKWRSWGAAKPASNIAAPQP